ncbi:YegS/Rv2252/BmrU family lipid kinase [Saccharopolyspora rhizosphaerae]|uniref:YegS/Rv2252/BmrU family lipid kinase n=1 Tax=Saccharopolyspora rhizosphaerae TaxID=2492662 RepID=A0A426JYU1_9PSEU|nr:YegS/Rv2252/BmrU family lipid kinase [Saccharopolyspora rhizosphaerae]RRO18405.1 YegS/Rv2252/BmrU family lipid kinase [Saccharopolyspora rhizosphaerae]
MRCVLVINPAAGGGLPAKVVGDVTDHLRAVCEVRTVVATDPAGTEAAVHRAVEDRADVLAVVGGDGIAHLAVQACAESATALAIIPAGTGNDLARSLDIPREPVAAARAAARAIAAGARRHVDLGKIAGTGWFATVLCAGFDAKVNARANRMRWPRGQRRYDIALVRELLGLRTGSVRVETEHGVLDTEATLVAVANTSYYGGGIPICPDAVDDDGQFDVTVVGRVPRRELVRILPSLRTGRHVDHPAVSTLRAKNVRLGGAHGWLAYADGEPQARLPLTIRCAPGALSVVCATRGGPGAEEL